MANGSRTSMDVRCSFAFWLTFGVWHGKQGSQKFMVSRIAVGKKKGVFNRSQAFLKEK
jgi:hypothetical protein